MTYIIFLIFISATDRLLKLSLNFRYVLERADDEKHVDSVADPFQFGGAEDLAVFFTILDPDLTLIYVLKV